MKAMRLVIATCAVLATATVAQANIILLDNNSVTETPSAAFTLLGAQGFGNAPRLLTMQGTTGLQGGLNQGYESGYETPISVENGDAIDGADKSTTPTLATLGWTSGNLVGIGLNLGQTPNSSVILQDLYLTLYNGTTAVGTFDYAGTLQFSATDVALQNGNGNGVFGFGLDAAQQVTFNTLVATYGTGLYAGLGATLGCQTAVSGCNTNDGPDSFVGYVNGTGTPVPDGGSMTMLLGMGLMSVAAVRHKLNRK